MSDDGIDSLITEVEQVGPNDTQPFANSPERKRRTWVPAVWEPAGSGTGAPKISGGFEADAVKGTPVPRSFNRPDQRYTQAEATLNASRAARAASEYASSVILQGAGGLFDVRSASGNNYDVKEDLSACDCPDWWRLQQSGKVGVMCKHMLLVQLALADPAFAGGLWITAEFLAQSIGISVNAVRYALAQGDISGTKKHGVWMIPPGQLAVASFMFTPLTPALSSISPSGATAGDPSTPITVTGTGYCQYSRIVWDATNALSTIVVSPTVLQATLPAAFLVVPGTSNIRVENAFRGGATSEPVPFIVA